MTGKPEVTCTVTSRHAAYNVTVRTTARTAHIDWYPAFDSGLSQRYIVWLVSQYYASTAAIINRYWADTYTCRVPILRAISFFCRATYAYATRKSVRPSVCHTSESRLHGSRYRNMLCTMAQNDVSSFLRSNFAI